MRLILFRHGPAGRADTIRWLDDAQRPLTDRGMTRTAAAARGIARLEPRVTLILTSPYACAMQTAQILAEFLPESRLEVFDPLRPDHPSRPTLDSLPINGDKRFVLVGHELRLANFAGSLLSEVAVPFALKKAGACAFDVDLAPRPSGRLVWLLQPRMLRRMSTRKQPV